MSVTVGQLAATLQPLFTTAIDRRARECHFVRRQRKVSGTSFLQALEALGPVGPESGPQPAAVPRRVVRQVDRPGGTELGRPAARRPVGDYFEAGTRVVWDVDPVNETVACYRTGAPDQPTTFRAGDQAEAEPAVPGWRLDVAALFR